MPVQGKKPAKEATAKKTAAAQVGVATAQDPGLIFFRTARREF
jgi:hypothetical protein